MRFSLLHCPCITKAMTVRHVRINPYNANHNNCHLFCHLLVILKVISANSVDPDQSSLIWGHTVCLYAKIGLKILQEYSAEDINRRHFQMQVFLAFEGLIMEK